MFGSRKVLALTADLHGTFEPISEETQLST